MVFVLLERRMDPKPRKPPFLFGNPFTMWTDLALKLWGFGKPRAQSSAPERPVKVAVIPTKSAQSHGSPKRAKAKIRSKSRSKRARR